MTAPFDPNNAPKGYVAAPDVDGWCAGCAFCGPICGSLPDAPECNPDSRPDGQRAIFIRRDSGADTGAAA
jgi:hypothetical protein